MLVQDWLLNLLAVKRFTKCLICIHQLLWATVIRTHSSSLPRDKSSGVSISRLLLLRKSINYWWITCSPVLSCVILWCHTYSSSESTIFLCVDSHHSSSSSGTLEIQSFTQQRIPSLRTQIPTCPQDYYGGNYWVHVCVMMSPAVMVMWSVPAIINPLIKNAFDFEYTNKNEICFLRFFACTYFFALSVSSSYILID